MEALEFQSSGQKEGLKKLLGTFLLTWHWSKHNHITTCSYKRCQDAVCTRDSIVLRCNLGVLPLGRKGGVDTGTTGSVAEYFVYHLLNLTKNSLSSLAVPWINAPYFFGQNRYQSGYLLRCIINYGEFVHPWWVFFLCSFSSVFILHLQIRYSNNLPTDLVPYRLFVVVPLMLMFFLSLELGALLNLSFHVSLSNTF